MPNAQDGGDMSSGTRSARHDVRIALATVALLLLVVPFALTLLLVQDRWAPLLRLDHGARDGLHRYAVTHGRFVAVMQLISNAGSAVVWAVILGLVVAWLLWRRLPRLAAFVVVSAAGSGLLNAAVKTAVHRLRPVVSDPVALRQGLSFPSAHAQGAVVGYALLLLVFLPVIYEPLRRLALAGAVLAVLAIGFSRIALGVHYVSDVVGGLVLGAAWVSAMAAAFDVGCVSPASRKQLRSGRSAADSQGSGRAAGP